MIVFLFIYPNFAGKDKDFIGNIQICKRPKVYETPFRAGILRSPPFLDFINI
jgi:hypothetical protein